MVNTLKKLLFFGTSLLFLSIKSNGIILKIFFFNMFSFIFMKLSIDL